MERQKQVYITVLVAALGYFVDIYDLLLFGIVRVPSLVGIGVTEDQLLPVGVMLLNWQMAGLLSGGVIWGVLGDKRGRLSVLFGSIFLYSVANIANAFVNDVTSYAALRFIAGIGLAGELGAAITLVSEVMTKEWRGIGTSIVAGVGILGAVFAGLVGDLFDWRTAYIIGGIMGLLLVLRASMMESTLYAQLPENSEVRRGDLLMLFSPLQRLVKYLRCIFIGVPLWFVVGILITFSPELGRQLEVTEPVKAGAAIAYCYLGLSLGDFASGIISQWLRSRKKVVAIFLALSAGGVVYYLTRQGITPTHFYAICAGLGFASGFWAIFVTIAAEQFGTNLRATVATTVPNFVRGMVVPLTLSFQYLSKSADFSLLQAAGIVGAVTLGIAILALWRMQETFGKELAYLEVHDPKL